MPPRLELLAVGLSLMYSCTVEEQEKRQSRALIESLSIDIDIV